MTRDSVSSEICTGGDNGHLGLHVPLWHAGVKAVDGWGWKWLCVKAHVLGICVTNALQEQVT